MTKRNQGARKRQRRVESKRFDAATRTLHMAFTSGEVVVCPLQGLPSDILFNLAAVGVVEFLSRAGDKAKGWEAIKSGEVFASKRKVYPLIVRALAELVTSATGEELSVEKAAAKYEALTTDEKRKLRYDPAVRAKMAEMSLKPGAEAKSEWMSIVLVDEPAETAEAA